MRAVPAARKRGQRGQILVEQVMLMTGVLVPLTFGIIYLCQLLWVWNSIVEFTRAGASYAASHCYNADASNVITYMQANVPVNLDQDQFSTGLADITINYYARDLSSGAITDYTCDAGDCTTGCIPDLVTVHVTTYQFKNFLNYLGIPAVTIPDFSTTVAMESAGCDPEQGVCLP